MTKRTSQQILDSYENRDRIQAAEAFKEVVAADWEGKTHISLSKDFVQNVVAQIRFLEGKKKQTAPAKKPPAKVEPKVKTKQELYRGRQRKLIVGDRVTTIHQVSADGTLPTDNVIYKVVNIKDNVAGIARITSDGTLSSVIQHWFPEDLILLKLSDFSRFPHAIQPGDTFKAKIDGANGVAMVVKALYTQKDNTFQSEMGKPIAGWWTTSGGLILDSNLRDKTYVYHIVDTPQ